ncbi:MAG: four helix bundle protein [Cytophagaceae bacterium]|nr:four helix bundle protein [Cytophagaceae bacterium]
MKSYRELLIWQKSILVVTNIYKLTRDFPKEELFGITSQMRRCAISIPSNIVEGFGRNSQGILKVFEYISLGSIYELQTQMEISQNLEYLNTENYKYLMESCVELEKMMNSLVSKKKQRAKKLTNFNFPTYQLKLYV